MGSRTQRGPVSRDLQSSPGDYSLNRFALEQTWSRLEQLQAEADRAAGSQYEEAVHGLRVSIRRFSQALILFPDLWPKGKAGEARKALKKLMELSSEVRNRDIALEHLADSTREEIKFRLRQERSARADEFRMAVERFASGPSAAQWRGLLERRLQ